ncbi:NAD(P)/FAD-dependent oxidoreductase [Bradyrhizobium sp. C-145]|uniref:flavin-containing monooxygenase n=1 Tax=Bradyrhizobium sp. C-145 TaxID=574727 RepID=UPI00201B5017|nr:NAD(P)/FAD-dependent oxidoreductase [Bradyrhizobium sp. C-145]UQR66794.1 NAD(P)/FAD-dependent oxidoreductase [Bradyrhizobium sp. C-145]
MSAEKHKTGAAGESTVDISALRARYRDERDRRLRSEGKAQYVEVSGDFARYLDDPWADPSFTRAAVSEETEVLIVGGGFGGLLCGARLRAAGIDDFRIVEKAADFGGTWYWNRYPGAACDTESYIYLPLLEETGYMPVRKYARAPEIYEHSRRIGRHFDLYARALFQTIISRMEWQEQEARWLVETDRGDRIRARFVILAGGPLSRPKLPGIPGIETFKGHSFHTSRWDYDYTGGTAEGSLTGLADKRVGIIGTGATAVQCVPHLGRSAKALYVFQRTPSAIGVRDDRPTDQAWAQRLGPGWQRERMDNFTAVISGEPFERDLVQDGWTGLLGEILLAPRRQPQPVTSLEEALKVIEQADYRKMEEIRARVDAIVKDEAAAAALKPWYKAFCKRPCFHDEYLDTFNRPNVHLVDSKGQGVERITENAVVVDGKAYELDCLIYASGFEVGTDYARRMGFEVYGRDGTSLSERWRDGVKTLHGFYSRGFPNCFLIVTVQAGQSANFPHIIDEQSQHIAYVIAEARKRKARTLEPTLTAEMAWVDEVVKAALGRQTYLAECTPGYYNNEGVLDPIAARNSQYWRGPVAFLRLLDTWRKEGNLEGLELSYDRAMESALSSG